MSEPTVDPTVVITRREGSVVWYESTDGDHWWADNATCDQCGLCWSPDDPRVEWRAPRGTPGAAWLPEPRLDNPVRPEIVKIGCHMKVGYGE